MPLVSVLLATHNGTRFLTEALRSVLTQTETDLECIIIDDASTEDSTPILNRLGDRRIRVIRNDRRQGLTKSLNRGIQTVRGMYVARIDDDDVWIDSTKLAKQVAFLQQHPNVAVCGTQYYVMSEAGERRYQPSCYTTDADIRQHLLQSNQFAHSAVCIRTTALREVGGYNETLRYSQDYELWLRLGTRYQLANLPDVCVAKREHATAISRQHHVAQCVGFVTAAYRHRHAYPGFARNTLVYARELALNAALPKEYMQGLVNWRQAARTAKQSGPLKQPANRG